MLLRGGGACLSGKDNVKKTQAKKKQNNQLPNLLHQKSDKIEALQKANIEENTGLITFDIGTENQLKVFFANQDTECQTNLDRLIQVYDKSCQNLHQSKKFNDLSLRFVNPSQLKQLAHKVNTSSKTLFLDLIRSIQIVGNKDTLEQLRVQKQDVQNPIKANGNDTVLHEAFAQIQEFHADYQKYKGCSPSRIQFFKDDIILLEDICRGGQGEVRVGFNKKTKKSVVIKRFLSAKSEYYRERDMYKYLNQKGCSDLVLELLEFDDANRILVMERGTCDLKTFAELRRQPNHPDGPLTALEVLLIMDYTTKAMQRLWKNARVCLCDVKEQNILVTYSEQGLGGYKPILTDLGSAYCKQVDRYAAYPVAYTFNYFNPTVLQNLENRFQIINPAQEEKFMIQSELYTMGRMIQSLLAYCIPNDENFNQLRELFSEHDKIEEYLELFQNSLQNINNIRTKILELVKNILVDNQYFEYQTLINDITSIKMLAEQISNKKIEEMEFLNDSSGSMKQWQQSIITRKSDFSLLKVGELKQQSEFYHEHDLFSNSIAINQKLLEKLETYFIKQNRGQPVDNYLQANEILALQCQTLKQLGNAHKNMGNTLKSLQCHEKELQIRMKLSKGDENNDEIAECCSEIGWNNLNLGKIDKADNCFQISLRIKNRLFDEYDINLANTYKNIGNVYYYQGKLEQALELYTKCLNIKKQHYAENNINLASTYSSIAQVYDNQGNLEQALDIYMKCLSIQKAHYGENNFNLAKTYNNIGGVYQNQGRLEQALQMYLKSLNIKKQHYGDNNFNLANTYCCIGSIYDNQGKLEQALDIYMKCLNIQKAHYGDKNFNLAATYSCIGTVYYNQGKLEQALEMHTKCLNIMKAHYGENNFNLAVAYNNIGSVYYAQQKLEQVLEVYNKCLNIQKAHYGDNNFNLATTYYNLSILLAKMKNLQESFQMAQKSHHISSNHYGKNHSYTQNAKQQCDQLQKII